MLDDDDDRKKTRDQAYFCLTFKPSGPGSPAYPFRPGFPYIQINTNAILLCLNPEFYQITVN